MIDHGIISPVPTASPRIGRSVLAVVAGYLAMLLCVTSFFAFVMQVIDLGDPKTFEPPMWLYAAELVASAVAATVGGYVCAWIARRKHMHHALALAAVIMLMGIASIAADGDAKPLWSGLSLMALGCIGAFAGTRLRLGHERALR